MKLGNKIIFLILFLFVCLNSVTHSEDKITTSPLINLDKIKPSFEEIDLKNESSAKDKKLKKKNEVKSAPGQAILIGLDKITAKSSKLSINLNKTENFGPLEIKILKCEKIKNNNKIDNVAYMQVKDTSKSENEKVFIFNGWTFASDPHLTPFDHAIYDLQLINCSVQ